MMSNNHAEETFCNSEHGKSVGCFFVCATFFLSELHVYTLYPSLSILATIDLWWDFHKREVSRLPHLLSVVCHPETCMIILAYRQMISFYPSHQIVVYLNLPQNHPLPSLRQLH